jgi:hypothetical protein
MSIIGWFKKKKKEKEEEDIKTILGELPPPVKVPIKVPTEFDVFLQTIEKVVKK